MISVCAVRFEERETIVMGKGCQSVAVAMLLHENIEEWACSDRRNVGVGTRLLGVIDPPLIQPSPKCEKAVSAYAETAFRRS
jgi:hypothetical protein